jgi:hypothetical protein
MLLRDGCFGQINAAPAIDAWAKEHGRSLFLAKYSAGCSMTESMNDLGHGHDGLHKLVSSSDFKCKQYEDPPGPLYAAAKAYLAKYLTPSSFKTYWKFLCCFEPFVLKALNPMNLLAAAKMSGFDGEKINIQRIMSHNLEFAQIQPPSEAEKLLGTIEGLFSSYWWHHGLIHENIFDEVFDGVDNIDALCDRAGKPLNQLATNRQRFMCDNHESWIAEINRRNVVDQLAAEEKARKRAVRDAADALKPAKFRKCSDLACGQTIDISTSKLKSANEKTWRKCVGKSCPNWGCPLHFEVIELHERFCGKVAK